MPLTPFHLGPGMLLKGMLGNRFSLTTFALANAAIDIEPLYRIWHGDLQLHGLTHTVPGALAIGAAIALAAPRLVPVFWRRVAGRSNAPHRITPGEAWLSAQLGTISHLLLDAVMHLDMQPFWPVTQANPLLNLAWTQNIYLGCVLAGMFGLLLFLLRAGVSSQRIQ